MAGMTEVLHLVLLLLLPLHGSPEKAQTSRAPNTMGPSRPDTRKGASTTSDDAHRVVVKKEEEEGEKKETHRTARTEDDNGGDDESYQRLGVAK